MQPAPKKVDGPAIWDLVLADIEARDRIGQERYGVRLQAHNGRDALQDAYEEALDLVVYLRQAIAERDAAGITVEEITGRAQARAYRDPVEHLAAVGERLAEEAAPLLDWIEAHK